MLPFGCMARRLSDFGPGLIAEDLSEALPKVYRRLHAERIVGGD